MNNLRFATAIHILVLTEKFQGQLITSEFIAGSINVNPVVVRREIRFLKDAGYLKSKKGKDGGCYLSKDPKNILLGDLYKLVNQHNIFLKTNKTNPKCSVGINMNMHLEKLFNMVELNLINDLNKSSLKNFSDKFL